MNMTIGAILSAVITYVPYVVMAASAASASLPKSTPGSTWAVVRSVIDVLGVNVGNAKNAK